MSKTIRLTDTALRNLGVSSPRVVVARLNPHASDGGLLGSEDDTEIEPAVERAREEEIDAVGPESPDIRAGGTWEFDCVVSMYHDLSHILIKMLGFADGSAVWGQRNHWSPINPDECGHGTAFDIAGEGIASE